MCSMSSRLAPFALGGFNDAATNAEIKSFIGGKGGKGAKTKSTASAGGKGKKGNEAGPGKYMRYEDIPTNQAKMREEAKLQKQKEMEKKKVNWREKHEEQLRKKIERREKADKGVRRGDVVEFDNRNKGKQEGDVDDEDDFYSKLSKFSDGKNQARAGDLDLDRFGSDSDDDDEGAAAPSESSSTTSKPPSSAVTQAALRLAHQTKIEEALKSSAESKKKGKSKDEDLEEDFDFGGEVVRYRDDSDLDEDDVGSDDDTDDDGKHGEDNADERDDQVDENGLSLSKFKKIKRNTGFEGMNLLPGVYQGIRKMGFRVPTPIQRKAIPYLLEGRDCVAMARTGSGKTAAFTIPILNRLQSHNYIASGAIDDRQARSGPQWCRAVVLSPTRELAMQTHQVFFKLGRFLDMRYCLLVGGQQMEVQFTHLTNNPDIIIATPGRLIHHMIEVRFELTHVEILVFDEADRMFELGFAAQINEVLKRMNSNHLTWLFSATMPKALAEFSRAGLKQPVTVRLDNETKLSPDLAVSFFMTRTDERIGLLHYLLTKVIPENEQLMVFGATKLVVEYLEAILAAVGHSVKAVHGTMDAEVRNTNVADFRARRTRVLIATDVAARGIDIPLLDNVLNFDFPPKAKLFIHRCGRVARAGRRGLAMSFVTPQEIPYLLDVYIFFGWPLQQFISRETEFSASPADREIFEQARRAAQGNNERDNVKRTIEIGRPPAHMIEPAIRAIAEACEFHDFSAMERAANNSYKLYRKTRDAASMASAKMWKEMQTIGFHPLFYRQEESKQSDSDNKNTRAPTLTELEEMDRALQAISRFTPRETVFELLHADHDGVIKAKRRLHDPTIRQDQEHRKAIAELLQNRPEAETTELPRKGALASKIPSTQSASSKAAAAPSSYAERARAVAAEGGLDISGGSVGTKRVKRNKLTAEQRRDAGYISTLPTESYIEELGLSIHGGDAFNVELTSDTTEGLATKKKQKVWDPRKKDFKTEFNNRNPFGQLKNEAGKLISSGKGKKVVAGELYEKWVQGGKINPREKVKEVTTYSEGVVVRGPVVSELKSPEQIIKSRKTAEVYKAKYAPKNKKKH